jgi:hypothetical protein
MQVLVVRDAFADYGVGAIIRDPAAIQAVRDADQAHFCTPTVIEDGFFAGEAAEAPQAAPAPMPQVAPKTPPAPSALPSATASDA